MGSSVFAPGAKEAEEKEEEKVVGEAIFLGSLHTEHFETRIEVNLSCW
jgi:hypothetical protein